MMVLDLFSGLGGWARPFRERGHRVVTLDIEPRFGCDLTMDVLDARLDVPGGYDLIVASPPCEAFSVASIGTHWKGGWRAYEPNTGHAELSMRLVQHTLQMIADGKPRWWVIENPRGVLRKLPFMQDLERRTVTYCQYGESRMKPTDLWGGFPKTFVTNPMCSNGDPCHERAPRGAKTGTQGIKRSDERALIPYALALELCLACEREMT